MTEKKIKAELMDYFVYSFDGEEDKYKMMLMLKKRTNMIRVLTGLFPDCNYEDYISLYYSTFKEVCEIYEDEIRRDASDWFETSPKKEKMSLLELIGLIDIGWNGW